MKRTPAGLDLLTGSYPNTLPIVHWHRGRTGDKDKTAKNASNSITNDHSEQSTRRPLLAGEATLRMLRGDEGLDERVGGLRVERQGVAQRRQLGALLQEGLLQAAAAGVEVLLQRKESDRTGGTASSTDYGLVRTSCPSLATLDDDIYYVLF